MKKKVLFLIVGIALFVGIFIFLIFPKETITITKIFPKQISIVIP